MNHLGKLTILKIQDDSCEQDTALMNDKKRKCGQEVFEFKERIPQEATGPTRTIVLFLEPTFSLLKKMSLGKKT